MTNVLERAQEKREELVAEIQRLMTEMDRLDDFIKYGARLATDEQVDAELATFPVPKTASGF